MREQLQRDSGPQREQFWIVKDSFWRARFITRFWWNLGNNRTASSSPCRLRNWWYGSWLWCWGPKICRLQRAGGIRTHVAFRSSWRWVSGHSVQNVRNDWLWTWNHSDKEGFSILTDVLHSNKNDLSIFMSLSLDLDEAVLFSGCGRACASLHGKRWAILQSLLASSGPC